MIVHAEPVTLLGSHRSALSWVWYYSIGGVTVDARASSGQISYMAGDQQGMNIDAQVPCT